ncbi:MAG: hypothetical protein ABJH68_13130 [Ilumatobacter sp.]|uniref:hypothetical protein n=1 Tax=Ilumatobacter sp. TaxID=1967498 RepID=UPI00329686A6
MNLMPHPTNRLRRPLAVAALAALALTACGGSDDSSTDTPAVDGATQDDASVEDDASVDEASSDSGEPPIGVDESGDIDFSDDVDSALDAVGFEGIVGIAADQLDPKPAVEVDGDNATLTFSEGSVEADAWLPCSVMSALISDGQTVTVVYPDGEQVC